MIIKNNISILRVLFILVTFTFLLSGSMRSYALQNPPIVSIDAIHYGGGNQNWMLDQLPNNDIVVGNEEGLLIFDGSHWKLYKSPYSSVLRSVHVSGNRVYSGSIESFGYWEKKGNGEYFYTSISRDHDLTLKKDEQFWNVLTYENMILFQSLDQIYLYDPLAKTVNVIKVPNGVNKVFKLNKAIYFQSFNWDLYKIVDNEARLYYPGTDLPPSEIIKIFSTEYGLKFFSKAHGFYQLVDGKFVKWYFDDSNVLELGDFFSATQLRCGDFALGSITRGVFIFDKNGKLKYQLDQLSGIGNNTVLSLFEDRDENLWLGLDNGISIINLKSPFSEYLDKKGRLGTVYASLKHNNYLYIGTNQGLFYKKADSADEFELVENSNGQVWSLSIIGEDLFCGHNLGTYIVEDNVATRVVDLLGTWKITDWDLQNDFVIQGNYEGLHMLERSGERWKYRHQLEGLDYSMRVFVIKGYDLVMFHASEGLIHGKIDSSLTKVSDLNTIKISNPSQTANLVNVGGEIFYSDSDGIFRLSDNFDELIQVDVSPEFRHITPQKVPKLIREDSTSFWVIYEEGLILAKYLKDDPDTLMAKYFLPIDPYLFKIKYEFENISKIGNNQYLLGTTKGYLVVDFDHSPLQNDEFQVSINSITLNIQGRKDSLLDLQNEGEFKSIHNNFTFSYQVGTIIKYRPVLYQYKLEGDHNEWSDWSTDSDVSFYKLKPGSHTFMVRAKVSDVDSKNIASYSFKIKPPWFLSGLGLFLYAIILILLVIMVNSMYNSYYSEKQKKLLEKNQKELEYLKLKSDQELIQLKNDQLKLEIEAKNKELAVTAMNVVKKNEFLMEIKDALQHISQSNSSVLKVLKSVNKEIENEESWEMLKNAFENVDKDFIQTIIKLHPRLTPNDLKLCTYLRLNLSSKEIASLLNVSVRSMETKRYRLRQKMELKHETNLVEYILSI